MLAVLDYTIQGIIFLVALLAFVLAVLIAVLQRPQTWVLPVALIALGLALGMFVACWNAFSLA